jgi:hypothetical protein
MKTSEHRGQAAKYPPLQIPLRGCVCCRVWYCDGAGCGASAPAVCIVVVGFEVAGSDGRLEREAFEAAASCESCALVLEDMIRLAPHGTSQRYPLPSFPADSGSSSPLNHRTDPS